MRESRHGQGKRWRVRYNDANGEPHTRFFERKADADAWDAAARAGTVDEVRVDQAERRLVFQEYAERSLPGFRQPRHAQHQPDRRARMARRSRRYGCTSTC
ncbi:hypothetical protein GCM10009681_46020 [Luedemannella helvata]|uniref:Uncharacterized protein n=1 Tax=Luedemannella helvata TaxID=349315 RepID=A0ABP4X7I1_9ACTN